MAVKCFTDGGLFDSHANLQFIWEIDGYNVIPHGKQQSCSFFDVPLANHCSHRDNISMVLKEAFIGAFAKAD